VQGVQMVEGPTSSDDERYMDEFGGGSLPEPPAVEDQRDRGDQS